MQRVFVCVFMSWLDCADSERFKGMNETECRSTLTGATGGVEPEPRVSAFLGDPETPDTVNLGFSIYTSSWLCLEEGESIENKPL